MGINGHRSDRSDSESWRVVHQSIPKPCCTHIPLTGDSAICIYTCIYIYVCIYIYIFIYLFLNLYIYISMSTCITSYPDKIPKRCQKKRHFLDHKSQKKGWGPPVKCLLVYGAPSKYSYLRIIHY